MKRYKLSLLSLLLVCLFGLQACGSRKELKDPAAVGDLEQRPAKAGKYGMLSLGVQGQELTGYFEHFVSRTGQGCVFFLQGKIGENPMNIQVYYPEIEGEVKGILMIKANSVVLRLDEIPAQDCDPEFSLSGKELFVTEEKSNWQAIRIVREQAYFHAQADANSKLDKYVLPYNYVQVLEQEGDWLRVEYQGLEQVFSGWISSASLFPLRPNS